MIWYKLRFEDGLFPTGLGSEIKSKNQALKILVDCIFIASRPFG